MHRLAMLGLLGAILAPLPRTQSPAPKALRFDTGGLWHSAVLLATDGDLTLHSNYALPPGSDLLQSGVQDVAVLAAHDPGAAEQLVTLNASGASTIAWSSASSAYVATPWNDSALAGAVEICSSPFNYMHAVATLGSDLRTVRCYRHNAYGPMLLSQFVAGTDIVDLEVFLGTDGLPYVLAATAGNVLCYDVAGTVEWSFSCAAIDLAVLPDGGANGACVAVLEQFGPYVLLQRATEVGIFEQLDVTSAVPSGTLQQIAFADENGDAMPDLMVVSDAGVTVLRDTGTAPTYDGSAADLSESLPDVGGAGDVLAGVGSHVRWIAQTSIGGKATWTRLVPPGEAAIVDLALNFAEIRTPWSTQTPLWPTVLVGSSLLTGFVASGNEVAFEVHVWFEAEPNEGVGRNPVDSDFLLLDQPPAAPTGSTEWWTDVVLDTAIQEPPAGSFGWVAEEHYFMTVRLVQRNSLGEVVQASDSITLGATLSIDQQDVSFSYLRNMATTEPEAEIIVETPGEGGIVVGVVTQLPPPPSFGTSKPSQPTTERTTTQRNSSTGTGGN